MQRAYCGNSHSYKTYNNMLLAIHACSRTCDNPYCFVGARRPAWVPLSANVDRWTTVDKGPQGGGEESAVSVDGVWRDILDDAAGHRRHRQPDDPGGHRLDLPDAGRQPGAGRRGLRSSLGQRVRPADLPAVLTPASNARELLMNMVRLHEITTRTMDNTHPLRFDYKEPSSPESSPS